jgi:hypothetical protein
MTASPVNADNAIGCTAAEQITPYPPGIPVIVPGERITAELLKYLRSGLAAGMQLPDPADPSLQTIRVVAPHLILATADGGEGLRHSRGDAAGVKPGTSPARARARPLEPTHWGWSSGHPPPGRTSARQHGVGRERDESVSGSSGHSSRSATGLSGTRALGHSSPVWQQSGQRAGPDALAGPFHHWTGLCETGMDSYGEGLLPRTGSSIWPAVLPAEDECDAARPGVLVRW